jgi:hypothetical protein
VNVVRLQALHRAPPQQPTMSVVNPEGGPAASVILGQKSCVRSSGIITLLARQPSDSSGQTTSGLPLWKEATAAMTALVYFYTKGSFYSWDCTLYMCINKSHGAAVRWCSNAKPVSTGLFFSEFRYNFLFPFLLSSPFFQFNSDLYSIPYNLMAFFHLN